MYSEWDNTIFNFLRIYVYNKELNTERSEFNF